MMSRTRRLRTEIVDFLSAVGEANTTTILEHVNKRFRWGAYNESTWQCSSQRSSIL